MALIDGKTHSCLQHLLVASWIRQKEEHLGFYSLAFALRLSRFALLLLLIPSNWHFPSSHGLEPAVPQEPFALPAPDWGPLRHPALWAEQLPAVLPTLNEKDTATVGLLQLPWRQPY